MKPLYFLIFYLLLPKIQVRLKYFLDKNSHKRPQCAWYGMVVSRLSVDSQSPRWLALSMCAAGRGKERRALPSFTCAVTGVHHAGRQKLSLVWQQTSKQNPGSCCHSLSTSSYYLYKYLQQSWISLLKRHFQIIVTKSGCKNKQSNTTTILTS